MNKFFVSFLFIVIASCQKVQEPIIVIQDSKPLMFPESSDLLKTLPENLVASDSIKKVFAKYTQPTTRYNHGILGDNIEAGSVWLSINNTEYIYTLDDNHVFEDLMPRLVDVDSDEQLELVTIRTHIAKGASVAIFKVVGDKLTLWAESDYIGTANRWLNIAAVADLDKDGIVEVAWVHTPHIGGILKVAKVRKGILTVLDSYTGVTNHKIGSKNLCLSVLTLKQDYPTLWLPNDGYNAMQALQFRNGKFVKVEELTLNINSAIPLINQVDFKNVIYNVPCIVGK